MNTTGTYQKELSSRRRPSRFRVVALVDGRKEVAPSPRAAAGTFEVSGEVDGEGCDKFLDVGRR